MFTFSLTLIRHGETQYNRDGLLQGQGVDTVLSETGIQQCEVVGRYFRDTKFSNVFVSDLQRTIETAEIILRNSRSAAEIVLEPLLRERSFGIFEGRAKEDLKNAANACGQSCRDFTPPGGETPSEVRLRFKKFLKVLFRQMLDEHGPSGPADSAEVESEPGCCTNGDADPSGAELTGSADDGLHGVPVHALGVSHGTYINIAIRHIVEDLDCSLPAGMKLSQLFCSCPNTGISRFVFTLRKSEAGPVLSAARCIFTNRKHHLETQRAE
ncbi:fructose-2,6-bisphosphatase TIGAR B [Takifugu flavidus]|uniref:fructose-2,6-bisphosphate 2-phosphatase n=1 Tax=Takifugu flavidus TaxID=433684 RepID=A0A5C6NBG2_9TELE|nr:fructose-2,6-bisphosphatase TIGAR B [Takifugu flavidus]TWW64764.1 Fructose-2,6-bisphosphatase TIGAR B [Takifugu flavidus]